MKKTYKGFTLIELLVVIAIIGVLIAILVPAIASTRERSQIAACINNLKQISVAAFMYADDHDSVIPDVSDTVNYLQNATAIYKCPRDTGADRAGVSSYTAYENTPPNLIFAGANGPLSESVLYLETNMAGTEKANPDKKGGKFNTIVKEDVVFRHDGNIVKYESARDNQHTVVAFGDGRVVSCSKSYFAQLQGAIIRLAPPPRK